jgi:hypothetical protein
MIFLDRFVDERFLDHRRRSTSVAGMLGALVALGLFLYRFIFDHVWSWDLLAVGLTVAVVKLALMAWYLFTD